MKKALIGAACAAGLIIAGAGAGSASADKPDDEDGCNWGRLTAAAVTGGFPQGAHSSDPSGDGHGPGTLDEPRHGLANVVDQGDLQVTCEFIDSIFP